MEYLRKTQGESDLQYIIRLVEGKSNGTYDIDYTEMFKLGFGVDFSSDHCRKLFYSIRMLLPYLEKEKTKDIDSSEILNELEMKKLEIQKEKEKNRTIKIELNKMLRQDARFEMFWDEIKQSIENVEPPKFKEFNTKSGERIGIVGISDIHYSKMFKSINNTYSREICKERMNVLMYEIFEWIQERNISHIHIVNNGDNLDGLLRQSQLKVLETGVIDSAIEFGRFMVEWLNQISAKTSLTYHHVPASNHTEVRFFNSKAGQFADEDLEKVIINYIHDMLQNNERIEVPIYNSGFIHFIVNGKTFVACHGHQLQGKNLNRIVQELQMILQIKIDCILVGHEHHEEIHTVGENDLGNIKVIMFPSIMGSDTYSDKLLTGSKAGATLIELDALKKGLKFTEVILN